MRQDQAVQDISALLKARNTLLWLVSGEELRVERALISIAESLKYSIKFWDCADGFVDGANRALNTEAQTDPLEALGTVKSTRQRTIYVFRDLHKWGEDPYVVRNLRSLARRLQGSPYDEARAIIVLTPSAEIPSELTGTPVINWPLPDREEMALILDQVVSSLPSKAKPTVEEALADNGNRDTAIDAALGLNSEEAQNAYAFSVVTQGVIDPAIITAEKKRVVSREKVLTWHQPDPNGLDSIGGLDLLKTWLNNRKAAFSSKAREYGLPAPKGALLVGPPGTGKSLTAKCIATAWGQPLLRIDLGALRSKYVGDSEQNIRKALALAEAVAPCVVWMDEIEKSLAGATGVQGDGGVGADALGTILSWMQEKAGNVFVVATANNIQALAESAPELLRKGRFDELFFIDLPTSTERHEVLAASLRKHGRDPGVILKVKKDRDTLMQASDGFTGAEIDAVVPEAMFAAFSDKAREITATDLYRAMEKVVPQSRTAAVKLTELREWAKGKTQPASTPEFDAGTTGRAIEV